MAQPKPMAKIDELALTAAAREHAPKFDSSIVGAYEMGRPSLMGYLTRHVTGDCGDVGMLADADAARGARLGPLAERLDRNAAAVADRLGTVVSMFRLGTCYTSRPVIVIRSELGLQGLTLAALAEELPSE